MEKLESRSLYDQLKVIVAFYPVSLDTLFIKENDEKKQSEWRATHPAFGTFSSP
jgi:hypothetical protein